MLLRILHYTQASGSELDVLVDIVHHIPIDSFFHTRNFLPFFIVPVYVCVCVCVYFFLNHVLASPREDNMHFKVLCVKFKVFPVLLGLLL